MFRGTATIRTYPKWIVAYTDRELGNYYRALIPKYVQAKPPKYAPHITIIRLGKESPPHYDWGDYDGRVIEFQYEPPLKFQFPYFFLDVYSEEIGQIRRELGLPTFRYPFTKYHTTIANLKD